jgi:4-amino-4-deoxy-L-arabinose transferase-like glycosyltransferase
MPLILILVLSAFLRFYQLGSIPPGLDWDEAAHGYNAYSLLKTGRDEYGYFMPLSFRSFDDYKPPLYTYLVVPSVAVFGVNSLAVRFPSAVLGVLAVLFTYLMVLELFKNRSIALLSAFFLGVSPWHLQFSRVAFETNSAIFWSVLATWAFLKGVHSIKKTKFTLFMCLSSMAFGANLFMYHNSRVFVPIFAIVLIFLFRTVLLKNIKHLVIPALIAAIFVITLIPILFSASGQTRYKGTTIFAIDIPVIKNTQLLETYQKANLGKLGSVFHNSHFVYVPVVIENYLSHLRPEYLFFTADMDRHHAPLIGLLYLWDLPFILAGFYFLAKKSYPKSSKIIVAWWFIAAPIAASVTWGVPHSLRSEIYLPTFQIFIALGVYNLYRIPKHRKAFVTIIAILFVANFAFYLLQYYAQMPILFSKSWYGELKQAVAATEGLKSKYKKIVVSTDIEQPYMFWLFYSKYDPEIYQKNGGTVSGGYDEQRNKFDKYIFQRFDRDKRDNDPGILYVGTPDDFNAGTEIVKKIKRLDGSDAIYMVGS